MIAILADLRIALRSLLKSRGFSVTAVVTLGLGMTLCVTVMAVVNAYLLNGLPYPAADRLYWIRYGTPGQELPRRLETLDWASLDGTLEHQIAWDLDMFYLLGGDHAESTPGAWVTPGFVEGFGIQPAIGRGFDRDAFRPGSANVALISHRLWTTRFSADPQIVGRTFTAYVSDRPNEAESFTIIGVMPQRFWHINVYTDIFAPLRAPTYPYMARLRPGVSPQAAAEEVRSLVASGAANLPRDFSVQVISAHDVHVQRIRPVLRAVGIAAAIVMLVACANLAGLLLIRAARRQKEVAVRTALGASRVAIFRMLLAEALLLGAAATIVALSVTRLMLATLAPLVEQQIGRAPGGVPAFVIDARVMAFAVAAGLLIAIVCTLAPLVTVLRPRLLSAIQSGSRTATEGKRAQRLRFGLIAIEIAASLALVAGSALLLRSVVTLLRADFGYTVERILNASLTLRQNRYPDDASRVAILDRIATRIGEVPGVESVAFTTNWPLQQPQPVSIEAEGGSSRAAVHAVSDLYFSTVGIPLAAGRTFNTTDRIGKEPVAVVSESLARRLWPQTAAVGKRLSLSQRQAGGPAPVSRVIVGVVGDVRQDATDTDLADLYVPLLQTPGRFALTLIRTAGDPAGWLPAVRAAFREIDPELALDRARPLRTALDDVTARPRFLASLLVSFALVAAVLALVGVYGVIAYAVRQREREIAVRLAIGADPSRITRLFLGQGSALLAAGLGLGVLGALGAGRLIESQLVGITPRDPLTLTIAVVAFAVAGLASIWWPSRRASMTDPAIALRVE